MVLIKSVNSLRVVMDGSLLQSSEKRREKKKLSSNGVCYFQRKIDYGDDACHALLF